MNFWALLMQRGACLVVSSGGGDRASILFAEVAFSRRGTLECVEGNWP